MGVRWILTAVLLACSAASLNAADFQTGGSGADGAASPMPVVKFELAFPGATPPHYTISVESTGPAAYRSDRADVETADDNAFTTKFVVSEATRRRIFELAKKANFFKGDFEYRKNNVANTGSKTLTYQHGPHGATAAEEVYNRTTYNYSTHPAIQELTDIFQKMSATLEFGNRISRAHRFDKLGLEAELKRMEQMQGSGLLLELHAIAPILQSVASDASVLNVTRRRAQRLLKIAEAAVQG